ncbi:MAG: hypothetical protein HUU21_10305 [Polyangiaceae bacterium]|nr:hypothetical protein [Polyangiaceae bacterium]
MREIHRSPYFILSVDDTRRILHRARTALGFPTLADAQVAYDDMTRAMDGVDRAAHGLFVDLRLAPPRNDAGFEQLVGRYYPRLYDGFPAIAVVVKTQAGRLQIARVAQTFGYDMRTFMTEAEAYAYLAGAPGPELPSRATPLPESRSASQRPPPGRKNF